MQKGRIVEEGSMRIYGEGRTLCGHVQLTSSPLCGLFDDRWAEASSREAILQTARVCASDREMLGLSAHILAFARRH